jgi:sterol desaturase/sphingolipid hydroxylase (fatty acid hydroxylase superfamily)
MESLFSTMSLSDSSLRSGIFILGFVGFSLIGLILPFRKNEKNRKTINFHNFALITINALMQKALGPLTLIALANLVEQRSWGAFNLISINPYFELGFTLVLLDLVIYFQHMLTHRVPLLWRLHGVHHTDTGFDTSTALRFHPLETLFSLGVKAFFVILLGVSPLAIFIFEVLINFSAMFHHSNFSLPSKIENSLRFFIVTPDMHRIHHSVLVRETDSNFSFFISAWDRIFGTYSAQSKFPPRTMQIGLQSRRSLKEQSFWKLLVQPFKG